ncbi:MAG: hypothetical protein K0R71_468 [Bacillales bacterium]|jgi:hypothetical protein|nr:hypothetical protein [Bacillales bacterium]
MVSHKKDQPLINIKQPSFSAEQPKMQTVFHYRKPNRDKLNKNETKNVLEEQAIEEYKEKKENEKKPEKLNFEIIEPVSNQSTNFTLFDLTQDPDVLIKNLMDSVSNPDSTLDLNSIFTKSVQLNDIDESVEIELKEEEEPNIYESISILEMAQDVLKDILKSQIKKVDVIEVDTDKTNPDNYLDEEST